MSSGEISQATFHNLYLPILSSTLNSYPLSSNNILSKHLLYYSVQHNEGVSVKRIQPPISTNFTSSPQGSVQDYFSTAGQQANTKEDSVKKIFKKLTKPGFMLQHWQNVSGNQLIWPLYHYSCDPKAIQYAIPKAHENLEDLIKKRQENGTNFSIKEILAVTKQLVQILILFEQGKFYHLNICPSNLIIVLEDFDKKGQQQIKIKITDFGARIQLTRIYYEMLLNFINQQRTQQQKKQNKKYTPLEKYSLIYIKKSEQQEIDQIDFGQSYRTFSKNVHINKQEQGLANLFENDIVYKCLLNQIQKLQNKDDISQRMAQIFGYFDRIMSVVTIFCLFTKKGQNEFKIQLSENAEQSFPGVDLDLQSLAVVLTNCITIPIHHGLENSSQHIAEEKVLHDIIKVLLSNDTEKMAMMEQFKIFLKDQSNGNERKQNQISDQKRGINLINNLADSENDSSDFSPAPSPTMKKENIKQQNQQLESMKEISLIKAPAKLEQEHYTVDIIIYFTNQQFSTNLLRSKSKFSQIAQYTESEQFIIDELYFDNQIEDFFANTLSFQKQTTFQRTNLIIIKSNVFSLKYFSSNKSSKKFLQQSQIKFYIEFDLSGFIDEFLEWQKIFQDLNGQLSLRIFSLQILGHQQLKRLIRGLIQVPQLMFLNLDLPDNIMNDETIFSLLALIVFTLPQLKECYLNVKSEKLPQSVSPSRTDLQHHLSPEVLLKDINEIEIKKPNNKEINPTQKEEIQSNLVLEVLNLNLSYQLSQKTIPILTDYFKYLKSLTSFSLNLSQIEQDENCTMILFESLQENFHNLVNFQLDLSKTEFKVSQLTYLKQFIGQNQLYEFSLNISDVKLSQKSCEQIKKLFDHEDIEQQQQPLKMQQLDLQFISCQMGDSGILEISQIFKCTPNLLILSLGLEKNSISEDGSQTLIKNLISLKKLSNITLNLRTNHIGQFGFNHFGDMDCQKKLVDLKLDLYNNQLQDKGLGVVGVQISKFTSLKNLNINVGMNNIREGFIMIVGTSFSQMKELISFDLNLELNLLDIEPVSQRVEWPLKNLSKTCNLQHLSINLSNCSGLKQDFIKLFFNVVGCLTSLKSLSLAFCQFNSSTKVLEYLGTQIPELKQLTSLIVDMKKCKIQDTEMSVLSFFIDQAKKLQSLTLMLEGNEISQGIERLAEKISDLKHLTTLILDFSKNPLDRDYLSIFIERFAKRLALEVFHLHLRECNLGDDELTEMARCLIRMDSTIELVLNFRDNKIKLRGSQVLGLCLNQLKNLRELSLDLGLRKQQILDLKQKLILGKFL